MSSDRAQLPRQSATRASWRPEDYSKLWHDDIRQHARRYDVTSWADADDGEREDCRERVRLVFSAAGEMP